MKLFLFSLASLISLPAFAAYEPMRFLTCKIKAGATTRFPAKVTRVRVAYDNNRLEFVTEVSFATQPGAPVRYRLFPYGRGDGTFNEYGFAGAYPETSRQQTGINFFRMNRTVAQILLVNDKGENFAECRTDAR